MQELERKAARGGAVSEAEIPPPISSGRRCSLKLWKVGFLADFETKLFQAGDRLQ